MATRTTYITVRLEITNEKADEITDDDIQEVVRETDYSFGNVGDFTIETEISSINE